MQPNISIVGQIGTTPATATTPEVKGVELMDVTAQARAAMERGETILVVGFNSPGGYVSVGNHIYDYLQSLKSDKIKVYTTTIPNKNLSKAQRDSLGLTDADVLAKPNEALVGSIATKDYLVGEKRFISANDAFFVHNPWMDPGPSDANKLEDNLIIARAEEQKFREFYAKATNNTIEALKPLMDSETSMSATQAIALGFATDLITTGAPVFASIKIKNKKPFPMSQPTKTIGQRLDALLASINKPAGGAKALMVTDAAGISYVIDAADLASSKDKTITLADADGDSTGTAAPDGPLSLADGSSITVAGGKVSTVTPAAAPGAPGTPPAAATIAAYQKATDEKIEKITDALAAIAEKLTPAAPAQALTKKDLDTAVLALKKEIGVTLTPSRVQMSAEQKKESLRKLSPIQQKMRGIKPADLA